MDDSLERYKITRRIGSGGVGVVYEAVDRELGRKVAVKRLLPPEESEDTGKLGSDLLKEARALSAFQHPNIVTVYDVGEDDDGCYIVMELLEGETLDLRIGRETLDRDLFTQFALQALDGLVAAHARKFLHRDLKPSNLFISRPPGREPRVKILDFGLSKFSATPSLQTIDQSKSILGSIYFLAPEQFEHRPLDARTDLYQLGCVFFYALTGHYAFDGKTVSDVMQAHLNGTPSDLSTLRPDLPPTLHHWVLWHLERDPARRPRSARVSYEALASLTSPSAEAAPSAAPPAPASAQSPAGPATARTATRRVLAGSRKPSPQERHATRRVTTSAPAPVLVRKAGEPTARVAAPQTAGQGGGSGGDTDSGAADPAEPADRGTAPVPVRDGDEATRQFFANRAAEEEAKRKRQEPRASPIWIGGVAVLAIVFFALAWLAIRGNTGFPFPGPGERDGQDSGSGAAPDAPGAMVLPAQDRIALLFDAARGTYRDSGFRLAQAGDQIAHWNDVAALHGTSALQYHVTNNATPQARWPTLATAGVTDGLNRVHPILRFRGNCLVAGRQGGGDPVKAAFDDHSVEILAVVRFDKHPTARHYLFSARHGAREARSLVAFHESESVYFGIEPVGEESGESVSPELAKAPAPTGKFTILSLRLDQPSRSVSAECWDGHSSGSSPASPTATVSCEPPQTTREFRLGSRSDSAGITQRSRLSGSIACILTYDRLLSREERLAAVSSLRQRFFEAGGSASAAGPAPARTRVAGPSAPRPGSD